MPLPKFLLQGTLDGHKHLLGDEDFILLLRMIPQLSTLQSQLTELLQPLMSKSVEQLTFVIYKH